MRRRLCRPNSRPGSPCATVQQFSPARTWTLIPTTRSSKTIYDHTECPRGFRHWFIGGMGRPTFHGRRFGSRHRRGNEIVQCLGFPTVAQASSLRLGVGCGLSHRVSRGTLRRRWGGRTICTEMADDLATLKRFYGWNAPIYDLTRWVMLRHRAAAAEALSLRLGDRVLDVGCGTGLNFRHLRRRVGGDGRIVGVDYSDAMLRRAARRRRAGTMLVQTEASTMRFAARFDGVLFAYSLTMIPDWRGAIARAGAHLVEGGRLVVLDFGRNGPKPSPIRRAFERYLNVNHVHPQRDLAGELRRRFGQVEVLRPEGAFITLLRAVR